MCPKCWRKLTLCDDCSHEATLHPPSPLRIGTGLYTSVSLTPITGRLTLTGMDCNTATFATSS
jgi:hypothetical protein